MIAGLVRAEWFKVRRMGITWLMLGVPLVLSLLASTLPIFGAAEVLRNSNIGIEQFGGFQEFLFPQAAIIGLQLVDALGSVLMIMFVTAIVGNEYRFDTWKTLLTRRASRARFLLVKMGYALSLSTLILIVGPIVFQLGSSFALKSVLDIDAPLELSAGEGRELLITFIIIWLRIEIAASIGLLTAIVARSAGGALTIGLPWVLVDGLASAIGAFPGFFRDIAPFTFNRNLVALSDYLQGGSNALSPLHVAVMLLIYTVGIAVFAITLFRRRDIAG